MLCWIREFACSVDIVVSSILVHVHLLHQVFDVLRRFGVMSDVSAFCVFFVLSVFICICFQFTVSRFHSCHGPHYEGSLSISRGTLRACGRGGGLRARLTVMKEMDTFIKEFGLEVIQGEKRHARHFSDCCKTLRTKSVAYVLPMLALVLLWFA